MDDLGCPKCGADCLNIAPKGVEWRARNPDDEFDIIPLREATCSQCAFQFFVHADGV